MDASFKQRIVTAAVGVPLVIALLFSPTPVVLLAVMAVSLIGMHEYYHAVGLSNKPTFCAMGYLAALVIPLGVYMKPGTIQTLVFLYLLVLFAMMLARHEQILFQDVASLFFGLVYIPYFLSHIIYIRELEFGNFYFWLVFLGSFITDSCAYFTGLAIGGRKLCPSISPKKTVAGAIGGVVGCGLSFLIFGLIANYGLGGFLQGHRMSLPLLFVLGLITAVVSEVGDLIASLMKRQYGIKDFGTLLPGHGGILDRCDSILLVAPTIFLFLLKIGILVS